MGYKNRYVFVKRTYPNTMVIFENNKNKYVGYDKDREFLEYIKFKKLNDLNKLKINYIVIRNMVILESKKFDPNMYEIYYTKFNLFKLVNYIRQRRRKNRPI